MSFEQALWLKYYFFIRCAFLCIYSVFIFIYLLHWFHKLAPELLLAYFFWVAPPSNPSSFCQKCWESKVATPPYCSFSDRRNRKASQELHLFSKPFLRCWRLIPSPTRTLMLTWSRFLSRCQQWTPDSAGYCNSSYYHPLQFCAYKKLIKNRLPSSDYKYCF